MPPRVLWLEHQLIVACCDFQVSFALQTIKPSMQASRHVAAFGVVSHRGRFVMCPKVYCVMKALVRAILRMGSSLQAAVKITGCVGAECGPPDSAVGPADLHTVVRTS